MKALNSRAMPWFSGIALPLLVTAVVLVLPERLFAQDEQRFNSPDEAVNALKAAVAGRDTNTLHLIFGSKGHTLVSADVVEATTEREMFEQRLTQKIRRRY
jgi:hypothetical protein